MQGQYAGFREGSHTQSMGLEQTIATNVLITSVHSNVSCNHMLYITGSLINLKIKLKTHRTANLSLLVKYYSVLLSA